MSQEAQDNISRVVHSKQESRQNYNRIASLYDLIEFKWEKIIDGILFECEDKTCQTGAPFEELGPQEFFCTSETSYLGAYGYAPYNKLLIQFSDRTRESEPFTKKRFQTLNKVTDVDDRLVVVEGSS